ncbi:MAG: amidohydrolase [Candidatus Altiarchaeota archaeon]|nr:amidohydrolase [Candidatus Altiarchaeota archaeon]
MSILIKNILLDGKETSIYIEDNLIKEIGVGVNVEADHVIDGREKAVIPGLINTHTHAAMTLFRGYADDMRLQEWLREKIWPLEAKLTQEDVYWGTKLACLEMIKTGTTCFNDMYWYMNGAAKAVDEMGVRAVLSGVFIDLFDSGRGERAIRENKKLISELKEMRNDRIIPALGPHAICTVSLENLEWIKEYSVKEDLLIHLHLAETEQENKDCVKKYGKRSVQLLEDIGFLGGNLICAHGIWLNKAEIRILAGNNVKISHNPTSNLKLASGKINYREMKRDNLLISLGTDGSASNNNLDMFEEMKFASLGQKILEMDPTVLTAREALDMSTVNAAKSLNIDAGEIREGKLADLVLIDLKRPELTPNHDLIPNLVYSANGSCVDTVICDGRLLMQGREVDGEEELLEKASEVALDLVGR